MVPTNSKKRQLPYDTTGKTESFTYYSRFWNTKYLCSTETELRNWTSALVVKKLDSIFMV